MYWSFDGWFGVPFKDMNCFTHIRSPHPYEILTLYGVSALILLYPCTISARWFYTPSFSCVEQYCQ